MKKILVVILLFWVTSAISEEVIGFKEHTLDSPFNKVKGNKRYKCEIPPNKFVDQACHLSSGSIETIAGFPVETVMLFYFAEKLGSITIYFDEKNFNQVTAALIEKYGDGIVVTENVQNKMGAIFEKKEITWEKLETNIVATRYTNKLDRSLIRYYTESYIDEFSKRSKELKKAQAKDL